MDTLTAAEFKREQRGVLVAMGCALVLVVAVMAGVALRDHATPVLIFSDRLKAVLRVDLFVVIWLAATIGNVARHRFFSSQDIAGSSSGSGSADVRQASAILQNTFEQTVLAIFTHMVIVATFDHSVALITAMTCLFGAGRLLFWAGYRYGAKGRAFGFALTFYPNVLGLLACLAATVF